MSFPQATEETPVENPARGCGFTGFAWVIPPCKSQHNSFPNWFSTGPASCSQVFHRSFHRPNPCAAGMIWSFPQVMCALYNKDKGYG